MRKLIIIACTAIFVSAISYANAASALSVGREDFGKRWPLTVEHGEMNCVRGVAVVFTSPDGKKYALNGTAMSMGFAPIDPIWRKPPPQWYVSKSGERVNIAPPRVNIGPLLDKGLALCKGS